MKTNYYTVHGGKRLKYYTIPNSITITRDGYSLSVYSEDGKRTGERVKMPSEEFVYTDKQVYTCIYQGCVLMLTNKKRVAVVDEECKQKLQRNEKIDVCYVDEYPKLTMGEIGLSDILFQSDVMGDLFVTPPIKEGDVTVTPSIMDYKLEEVGVDCRDEILRIIKQRNEKTNIFSTQLFRTVSIISIQTIVTYFVLRWCGMLSLTWVWLMIVSFCFTSVMRRANGSSSLPNALQQMCELAFFVLVVIACFRGEHWWHGVVGYILALNLGSATAAICTVHKGVNGIVTIVGIIAAPLLLGSAIYYLFAM